MQYVWKTACHHQNYTQGPAPLPHPQAWSHEPGKNPRVPKIWFETQSAEESHLRLWACALCSKGWQ